jgi:hypothetical protein
VSDPPVIYQHPLAYLLGLEGVALRAFAGVYDREITLARFREIQELLESPGRAGRRDRGTVHHDEGGL